MQPRLTDALRAEWPVLIVLYLLALVLRLLLAPSEIFGDEGWHYYVSKTWGAPVHNVHVLDHNDTPDHPNPLRYFIWRAGFFAALTPGSLLSFTAFRTVFILYTALLAPLLALVLRELNVQRPLAALAGLGVAVSPFFVIWGIRVFPDSLMAMFFLAGLWFWLLGRPVAAAFAWVFSVWCKEVAIVGVGAILLYQAWQDVRHRRLGWRPLRLPASTWTIVAACVAGVIPLLVALALGIQLPGWSAGDLRPHVFDLFFVSLWLAPIVLWGLVWRRTRFTSLLALVHPAFYLVYLVGRGRNVEEWYHVLPQLLTLVAVFHVIDESFRRIHAAPSEQRIVPRLLTALVAGLLLAGVLLPSDVEGKRALTPASALPGLSLSEAIRNEQYRDQALGDMLAHLASADRDAVFLLDVGWFFAWYPFGTGSNVTRTAYSSFNPALEEVPRWTHTVENLTHVTVLYKVDLPFSLAFRDTYRDCVEYENADYMILRPPACPGRGELLVKNYHARRSAAP